MRVATYLYTKGWNKPFDTSLDGVNTLIMIFASCDELLVTTALSQLLESFQHATVVGASTAGEIYNDEYYVDAIVVSVIAFEHTSLQTISLPLQSTEKSFDDGVKIAKKLYNDDMRGIFVLSDGLQVNGSQLTQGLSFVVGSSVPITGGLAGDDDRFEKTWIVVDKEIKSGYVCGVGFYGKNLQFKHASKGGWDRLGLQRVVTKSKNNVLYELDHQPALEIYKKYLGDKAKELPASGLLFPLELKEDADATESKVRTILGVNEDDNSITFAGDIPEGHCVTLMKANYNRLIDGASGAAESLDFSSYHGEEILSIAISCVGRRLVLKSRVEEELEAVMDAIPPKAKQIGFYSYGEISPLASGKCDLHNQTMTLTILWESDA